eukprot:scaffold108_cov162-Amphora_coffeaeformis.AAC.12
MSAAETKTKSSPPPPPNSAETKDKAKRNKKKKKHISKHVIKAKSEAQQKVVTTITTTTGESSSKTKKAAANETVKDPSEASEYLQAWQAKEGWKFNKNTQSWLLRHMYEAEKVSKTTFTILLEYMKGLQGKDAKKRVLEEATARAKRYRDYEKSSKDTITTSGETAEETNPTPKEAEAAATTTSSTSSAAEDDGSYGLAHWNTLDDHDKRKEYKRARRILELLTAD